MNQALVLFVCLVNVYIAKVSDMGFDHTLCDLNVNYSLLVSKSQNRVPVLLVFIGKV